MPGTDEDILRDLMGRATGDLHAAPAVTARVLARQRHRRWRNRAVATVVTGAAAGTVAGVVVAGQGGTLPGSTPARLTAAQHTLYQLSDAAAAASAPTGRYVTLTETQNGGVKRTSVLDGQTGDVYTYQQGRGVPPELPVARHDSPTAAEFAGWPTDPAKLRAFLLSQARQQNAATQKKVEQQLSKLPANLRKKKPVTVPGPKVTSDDLVFEQATDTLWNPLVPPALRSALYKVLAETPGVAVRTRTHDLSGRPATEISRIDNPEGEVTSTFENPATGTVLESLFVTPANKAKGATGSTEYYLYQPINSGNTLPANPYTR
ncbi:MAG TPA: hypothetical protein VGJ19_16875 [Streptosporangiaceae bacterium]